MSLFHPYWTEMHLAKSFLLSWCDFLCYSGDLMWCIIRTSVSAPICQELLRLLAKRVSLSLDAEAEPFLSLFYLWQHFTESTASCFSCRNWVLALRHGLIRIAFQQSCRKKSQKADLKELAGGHIWHENTLQFSQVICSNCWSINGLCLWCLVLVSWLWISYYSQGLLNS